MAIVPQYATATSDGSGAAVFTFPDVPLGQLWSGTTQVVNAPATHIGIVSGSGQTLGQMNGPGVYGPWTVNHSQTLRISSTGLVAATQYQAVWTADDRGHENATYPGPITPTVSGSVTIPTPLPVSGTVTATQGSPPWSVSVTGGTVAATQSGNWVVGTDPTAAPVTGQQTSNTSQVQLSSVSTQPPNGLLVTALPTNAAPGLYIGATGVSTSTGDLLQPGATKPFSCPPNAVYIIGANNTDKVTWELL